MKRPIHVLFFLILGLLTGGCGAAPISLPQTPSALDPHGPAAAHLANLWWVMLAFGTAVWLLVIVLMFAALLRRRRGSEETSPDDANPDTGRRWPLFGIGLALVILTIVFIYNIYVLAAVENPLGNSPVKIQIVGRRWWWEARYTDQGIETANEIHIPVGVPVQLQIQSADIIHSFWVPQLHGKMDAIPTRVNLLTIQADEPGVYRGECAEFCGLQHAHMGFMVVAQSKADFDVWVRAQKQPASAPSQPSAKQGEQVFLTQGCAFCHQIRGLDDHDIVRTSVRLGPDLTHLASRLTIAGASLAQNEGNLAGWIVDAQHVKPGSLMPNQSINGQQLQDLLAYLQTLH